ncbi:laccase domain-containing protein [Bdellovibrio bacteriovorus]|uniref:laccase domain-containing protein n=1 Tax=Bdellovibrio bacteriovorus TaxID=959 RepID=UPI0035A6FB78
MPSLKAKTILWTIRCWGTRIFPAPKNLALCVITADCVPVLFYHHGTGLVSGVHAGWRGSCQPNYPQNSAEACF